MSFWKQLMLLMVLYTVTGSCYGQTDTFRTRAIRFQKNSEKLSVANKKILDSCTRMAAGLPAYSLVIRTNDITENSRLNQLMWDRCNATVDYLVSKGFNIDKLVFKYASSLPDNDYHAVYLAFEVTDTAVANPPHPNFRRQQ